jgi:hypothetical protein
VDASRRNDCFDSCFGKIGVGRLSKWCEEFERDRGSRSRFGTSEEDVMVWIKQVSAQRSSEMAICARYTDCISVLVPKGVTQEMSLTIWIGLELGHKIIDFLELQLKETPNKLL